MDDSIGGNVCYRNYVDYEEDEDNDDIAPESKYIFSPLGTGRVQKPDIGCLLERSCSKIL